MSKRPPGASTAVAAADSGTPAVTAAANGEEVALAAPTVPVSAPPAGQPEPFAREAKWFSEQRALNREVRAGGCSLRCNCGRPIFEQVLDGRVANSAKASLGRSRAPVPSVMPD